MRGQRVWSVLGLFLIVLAAWPGVAGPGRGEAFAAPESGGWWGSSGLAYRPSEQAGANASPLPGPALAPTVYPAGPENTWATELVDTVRIFRGTTDRTLALDTAGQPHIVFYSGNWLYYAWNDGTDWYIDAVDDIVYWQNPAPSLALDAAGRPHITYAAGNQLVELRYAYFDGAAWLTQTVDSVGGTSSLALDAAGWPHVSYACRRSGSDRLCYAYSDGTVWLTQTVDIANGAGRSNSLALDAAGWPRIAYYVHEQNNPRYLRYAYFNGSAWLTTTVSVGGECVSLALDAQGYPHISHVDFDVLLYAWFDGTAWFSETLALGGGGGGNTSLALDGAGRPHLTYSAYSDPTGALGYAYHDGTSWITETVESGHGAGGDSSLVLDTAGRPHVLYIAEDNQAVKYAYRDGSAWRIQAVDRGGYVGMHTSLALDAADRPHISYCTELPSGYLSCRALKYAYYDGVSWQRQVVDDAGWAGNGSSLALDAAGEPHISYSSYRGEYPPTLALVYAYRAGSDWYTETVDTILCSSGCPEGSTSLALDALGAPHIGYMGLAGFGQWSLRYASYDGASWVTETVADVYLDSSVSLALDADNRPHMMLDGLLYVYYDGTTWVSEWVDQGAEPSLALDAAGRPHVSYQRDNLKYAWYDGTTWITETVDSTPRAGYYNSLALNSFGRPHIGYCQWYEWGDCIGWKYAYYDGTAWVLEDVTYGPQQGYFTSLALDSTGQPHIASYYRDWEGGLLYAVGYCNPVRFVRVTGPAELVVGETGAYTVVWEDSATHPIVLSWDNGTVGATAAYSWTQPGTYLITVTATNPCAVVTATKAVVVTPRSCWTRLNNDPGEYFTVQAAVDAGTHPTDVVKVAGTCSTLDEHGGQSQVVYLTRTLTIQGGYTLTNWVTPDPVAHPTTLDAQGQGRVLYVSGDISPVVAGMRLTGGNMLGWGGGVYVLAATLTLSNCQVFDNMAGLGGGIAVSWGRIVLGSTLLAANAASIGGGLFLWHGEATLSASALLSNTATSGSGGGAFLQSSAATFSGNTIAGNTAGSSGGGVYIETACPSPSGVLVEGNVVAANAAGQAGGGLYIDGGSEGAAVLANNVVADNRAGQAAPGLYLSPCSGQPARLAHNTVARNVGGDGSGILLEGGGVLTDTILVSQTVGITATAGSAAVLEATLWGSGAWANGQDWGGAGTIVTGTVNVWGDPAFVDYAAGNYHIGAASAARDSGVDAGVRVDIDGEPRPAGPAYDIGADELWAALGVTQMAAPDPVAAGAVLTYTLGVTNAGYLTLTAAITDVLPAQVTPTGVLTWTALLPIGGDWAWTFTVTVAPGYAGPLVSEVRVGTPEGASGRAVLTVTAEVLVAGLAAVNDSPTALGQPTTLTATVAAGSNVTYTWAFGDSSPPLAGGAGGVITHTYPFVGTYTAVVTASNAVSTATATTVVTIQALPAGYRIYLPLVVR